MAKPLPRRGCMYAQARREGIQESNERKFPLGGEEHITSIMQHFGYALVQDWLGCLDTGNWNEIYLVSPTVDFPRQMHLRLEILHQR